MTTAQQIRENKRLITNATQCFVRVMGTECYAKITKAVAYHLNAQREGDLTITVDPDGISIEG